jgi:cytoskeletal protein RodZ
MLIAILVLLGLAGAIWYFASKQTQTPSLTAEDLAEINRRIERDAALAATAVEPTSSISSPSVEQINAVLAEAPSVVSPATPVVEPIVEVPTPTTEASKPAKKKRRYYPKKK